MYVGSCVPVSVLCFAAGIFPFSLLSLPGTSPKMPFAFRREGKFCLLLLPELESLIIQQTLSGTFSTADTAGADGGKAFFIF